MRANQFRNWLRSYSTRLDNYRSLLNELDNRIGDGDHGTNMSRGFQSAVLRLDASGEEDLGVLANTAGMELLSHVGGASGPLYGTVFLQFSKVWKGSHELADSEVSDGISSALEGIVKRGKAVVGEKTMVDVWFPVVDYLKKKGSGTLNWINLVQVAQQSALQTKGIIARKGRASYLGERSKGVCDPGSISSAIFFEEMAEILDKGVQKLEWQTLALW